MDPGLVRDGLTVAAGVATGVLSAAFGVGGAVVSTPAIRALGVPALVAVGTTLPSVFPSAASGTARYAREGIVDWRVVRWTTPTGIAASVAGALLSRVVPGEGHLLMLATAFLLGFTAFRMARQPSSGEAGQSEEKPVAPSGALLASIGALAGLLSGLLGVGGGIVMVPAFSELARLPVKTTVASSLACVGIFAIPGTVTHAVLGGIDWRFAALLAIGVIPGARLG